MIDPHEKQTHLTRSRFSVIPRGLPKDIPFTPIISTTEQSLEVAEF